MSSKFIHLHTHSHYSLLNALPKIPELVKEAKKYGMEALAPGQKVMIRVAEGDKGLQVIEIREA